MKHVFISGIGHRLGFYLAQQFLKQGYQVSGHYHRERAEVEQLKQQGVTLYQADFTNSQSLQVFEQQLQSIQQLDVLVHNASIFYQSEGDVSEQAQVMEAMNRVHMQAPLILTETLKGALAKGEQGVMVAMTDIYVHQPNPSYYLYCASKAGLDSLMRSYVRRLAPVIRVNCIEPGPILFLDEHDADYQQQVIERTPLKTEGGLFPIWQTLQMIIENQYLTGAQIAVDGGRSIAQL